MEKQKRLVDLLLERTRAGKLDWKETTSDSTYLVSLASSSVAIEMEGRDDHDYFISLINQNGDVVDRFSDVQLDKDLPNAKYFKSMSEIFERARRVALGAERVLDDVLEELEETSKSSD